MNGQNHYLLGILADQKRKELLAEAADERRVRQARRAARQRGQTPRPVPVPRRRLAYAAVAGLAVLAAVIEVVAAAGL